jgi:hypothetical protein
MAPARVRTVTVGGRQYLQVVETQPGGSISIHGSFGEASSIENWLKANQYASSYNQLRDLAQTRPAGNSDDFFRAALAIFGVILGAAIVAALLGED